MTTWDLNSSGLQTGKKENKSICYSVFIWDFGMDASPPADTFRRHMPEYTFSGTVFKDTVVFNKAGVHTVTFYYIPDTMSD